MYTFTSAHENNEELEVTLMHNKTRENNEEVDGDIENNHAAMNIRATFTINGEGDIRVGEIHFNVAV